MPMLSLRPMLLSAALGLVLASSGQASRLPVFRFALERWKERLPKECYSFVIFHEGDLADMLKNELDGWEVALGDPARPANVFLQRVDVAQPIDDKEIARLFESQKEDWANAGKHQPWMVV